MSSVQVLVQTTPLGPGDQFRMLCYNQFLLELLTEQGSSGIARGERLYVALRILQSKNHTPCHLVKTNMKLHKTICLAAFLLDSFDRNAIKNEETVILVLCLSLYVCTHASMHKS